LGLRRAFVIGEIAIAFVLLTSMALLGRQWLRVTAIDPGFEPRGVLALPVSVPAAAYDDDRVVLFYATLQKSLEDRLGTGAVSIIDELPLTGLGRRRLVSSNTNDQGREAIARTASPGYFDVMRIPIVAGRSFGPEDTGQAPPRVVISASLAERLFGADAVGRTIRLGVNGPEAEVIGVAGDVKHRSLDEPVTATVYTPAAQDPSRTNLIIVRSTLPDADVIATVRSEVAALDRDVPVYGDRSMQEIVDASPGVPARRLLTTAFAAFALLGVVLSAIGLFGVAAHDVASRRPELALRLALGAEPRRILKTTFGRGALMVGIGLVAGGVLSIAATGPLAVVFSIAGVGPDLFAAGFATLVLATTAAVAVLPAAVRAARTDPATVLRSE
jgi:putative ABC transport system permease protein